MRDVLHRGDTPARLTIGALAVAAVLGSAVQGVERAAADRQVDEMARSMAAVARSDQAVEVMRRESDPFWRRIALARAVVAQMIDPTGLATLEPREAALEMAALSHALPIAQRLALEAVRERPVVWQGWMLDGASIYLLRSQRGDPRLFTEDQQWRRPLERSMALAPAEDEPARVLAGALIETWSAIPLSERPYSLAVVSRAFVDPNTLRRLWPSWLAVTDSRRTALGPLSDTTDTWRVVEQYARRTSDWDLLTIARRRWWQATCREGAEAAEETVSRVRGGELASARAAVITWLQRSVPDRSLAAPVEQLLTACPPGSPTVTTDRAFRPWLEWATDAYLFGERPLSRAVVGRLLAGCVDLPESEAATAEVVAGDLASAEALARRHDDLNTERWAPYHLALARGLLENGERDAARSELRSIHRSWRRQAPVAALAAALGDSETSLAAPRRWRATDWRWSGTDAVLDVAVQVPCDRLAVTVDQAPQRGAVVEISLDLALVELTPVVSGAVLEAPCPAVGRVVPLRIRSIAGGRVMPGDVEPLTEAGS